MSRCFYLHPIEQSGHIAATRKLKYIYRKNACQARKLYKMIIRIEVSYVENALKDE